MKLKLLFPVILLPLFLSGCAKLPFLTKQQAALEVNSSPQASVYINGSQVGQTPYYDDKHKPGQYTVRVLVDSDPTKDWQTQVTLNHAVVTVVNHQFGNTSDESSSYTLTLEPISQKDSGQLEVTSLPENVIVKVDGRPEGFSPLKLENVSVGEHPVNLTAPGYKELALMAKIQSGYKLLAVTQLARAPEVMEGSIVDDASASAQLATPSATPKTSPTPSPKITPKTTPIVSGTPTPTKTVTSGDPAKPYVVIKETGTSWLRVRSEPEVGDNEVAKVDVGTKHPYLDKTADGWYKIEYETGKEGWIVSRYADLVE